MANHATIDFETRSACDIKKYGAYRYAKHSTTQAMCLSYKLPGFDRPKRWHMAHPVHGIEETPPPEDLFEFIRNGGLVEAHNEFFERCIWYFVMVLQHGWPPIQHKQWRCSAAKASAASLPRDLAGACEAMDLPHDKQKSKEGRKVMLKLTKPRKPRIAEVRAWKAEHGDKPMPLLWNEDLEDLHILWNYCDQDVISEEALSEATPDLSPYELQVWQINQDINWRGVKFDLDLAKAALDMASEWRKRLNQELEVMTGISAATQRGRVKEWLKEEEGVDLPDTKAETLEWYIENEDLSDRAKRVFEIVMDVNKTSTRKYQTMLRLADPDDWRIRDILMYHGAHTGRMAGKGIQVQNFPSQNLIVKDMDAAAEDIKSGDVDWCHALYGDVMKLLSHTLRGAIIPSEGAEFIAADYSAVEARGTLWLAEAEEALSIFERGEDIYCDMASSIYGFEVNKKDYPDERQFGKQAILGLGYGMGYITFLLTCRKYKIKFSRKDVIKIMGLEKYLEYKDIVIKNLCLKGKPASSDPEVIKKYNIRKIIAAKFVRKLKEAREDIPKILHELALMKYVVDVYRARYPEVHKLWHKQQDAAIAAVMLWQDAVKRTGKRKDKVDGPVIPCGKVKWYVKSNFLLCELPSGRKIHYRNPSVVKEKSVFGAMVNSLRYWSVDSFTRKWKRTGTYGGKIVENIVQALTRDLLISAIVRTDTSFVYLPVMSVHDELLTEVDKGEGDVKEFENMMSIKDEWAAGFPLAAEGERLCRYKK